MQHITSTYKNVRKTPNLFVFETCTYIAELFIDAKAFLFFIRAIPNVANEDGEASHAWQRHLRSDPPTPSILSLSLSLKDPWEDRGDKKSEILWKIDVESSERMFF